MNPLSELLRYEIWIFLTVLAALIAYQLLTGRINTRGLIRDKMRGRALSPGRIQMLTATAGCAFYYVLLIFANEKPGELPEVPSTLLLILGGSHAIYLGGKGSALAKQLFGLSSRGSKGPTT